VRDTRAAARGTGRSGGAYLRAAAGGGGGRELARGVGLGGGTSGGERLLGREKWPVGVRPSRLVCRCGVLEGWLTGPSRSRTDQTRFIVGLGYEWVDGSEFSPEKSPWPSSMGWSDFAAQRILHARSPLSFALLLCKWFLLLPFAHDHHATYLYSQKNKKSRLVLLCFSSHVP
jgi:hypothetical protein